MRNESIRVLQREQDEALRLLESNPFLTSLFTKYVTEEKVYTSWSRDGCFWGDYDSLWEHCQAAAEDAEKDRVKLSKRNADYKAALEAETAARAEAEGLLKKALEEKDQAVGELGELCAELK